MRVLICPDSFSGTLTAVQAAEAMATGWRASAPHDELTLAPLSDGDTGFLSVVEAAVGGVSVGLTVSDPLGREVPAVVLLSDHGGERTAYLEAGQAAGLHHLGADERNPCVTSSYGVGQLLDAALSEGARRVVVGVGALAAHDGGAGLLAALGAGDATALAAGGAALADLTDEQIEGLRSVRARTHDVEIVVATDSSLPLLGFHGASATSAEAKGATPEQAQFLESALGHFTEVVGRALPPRPDLLTGLPHRLEREPGAGAGGGLAYALYQLGGRRHPGVGLVLDAWRFAELLDRHDLVLTGEGCFDWASLRDSVVAGVCDAASRRGLPVVVLAGQVAVGRRETMSVGVAGAYGVVEAGLDVTTAMADPVGTLERRAARLAATWSPRPGA